MTDQKPSDPKPTILPTDLVIGPDGVAIFTINEEGPIQGSYKGIFSLRCYLSPLDSLAAGRMHRELLGQYGSYAGEGDSFTAFCLSQLNKRVIKGPPWWNIDQPGNIPDLNILSLLLDRALTAETIYKERLAKMKEEALVKAQESLKKLQESANPQKKE